MMKQLKFLLALSLSTASLSCAATGGAEMSGSYDEIIVKAEQSYKAIAKKGGAWRDTGEMIDEAKKEAKAGNKDKALSLAIRAYEEANLAGKQHQEQAKAGPWLF